LHRNLFITINQKTKVMKARKVRSSWIYVVAVAIIGISAFTVVTSSCSKTETVTPKSLSGSGTDIIDIGDSVVPLQISTPFAIMAHPNYKLDQVHSNLGWQTYFQNNNALLTGRFNMFNTSIHFDQANPQNSAIAAWVDLSTFNTGEPGRDGTNGCGPKNMGIKYDTISGVINVIPSTDTAWFTAPVGSISAYGTGYVAHGNLHFRNIDHAVDMYFTYGGQKQETTSTGTMTQWVGFIGQFTMLANTWYGVSLSDAINDSVTVLVNYNAYYNNTVKHP
jgi:polyisoprenoid-binding protein YceI